MKRKKLTRDEILEEIKYQMDEGCNDCFGFVDWLQKFLNEQLN